MTHVKLINENTAFAPMGSNVMFRLGEGPSTERRTVCSILGSRLVTEKRLKHPNVARCSSLFGESEGIQEIRKDQPEPPLIELPSTFVEKKLPSIFTE